MTKLKLAVVGAGHLGRIHARLLAAMSEVELVAVADPLPAARALVVAEGVRTLADYRDLLELVDAVVIATPTRHHHAVALDFLAAGVDVFIEKPLTASLAEADEVLDAARRHGALVQVGHIERFNPAFAAAAPHVGRPAYIEAVRSSGFTGRSTDIGVVFDLMIHDIDLVLSLIDSPLERVSAMGLALLGRHEDVAQARLEFASGAVVNLSASRASTQKAPRRQMHIWSTSGFAQIDFGGRTAHVVHPHEQIRSRQFDFDLLAPEQRAGFQERIASEILRSEELAVEPRNALADELADFVAVVRGGGEPRVSGQQGRNAVAVAEAILESIGNHAWHGREAGPVGPLAMPQPAILRGPHWHAFPQPKTSRREAG